MQEEKTVSAKDKISSALARLIEKKHIKDITVAELTAEAGVGKSSFYRNFRDIYDVFEYLSDSFINRVCKVMLTLVLYRDIDYFKYMPEHIDFGTVVKFFSLTDEDKAVADYLLRIDDAKVLHSVVDVFAEKISDYARGNGLDAEAVNFNIRFIANGIYYSVLGEYTDNGSLNREYMEILMSFDIHDMK